MKHMDDRPPIKDDQPQRTKRAGAIAGAGGIGGAGIYCHELSLHDCRIFQLWATCVRLASLSLSLHLHGWSKLWIPKCVNSPLWQPTAMGTLVRFHATLDRNCSYARYSLENVQVICVLSIKYAWDGRRARTDYRADQCDQLPGPTNELIFQFCPLFIVLKISNLAWKSPNQYLNLISCA